MNKHFTNKSGVLRFRRWSRAGYAVFVSMTCAVTIGVLAVSVSEKSSQKTANSLEISMFCSLNENECECEKPEAILASVLEVNTLTIIQNNDQVARALQQYLKQNTNQTVDSDLKLSQPFFIL